MIGPPDLNQSSGSRPEMKARSGLDANAESNAEANAYDVMFML
jgi:hypothetical protein